MSAKRLAKRILKILGAVVLVLVLVAAIMTVLGAVLKDERGLSPWGTGFYFLVTGSMEPTMPVGTLVFVTTVSADSIKAKDVVTFREGVTGAVVTHRVREVTVSDGVYTYLTRGDTNNVDDAPLRYENIIGRVLFAIPGTSIFLTIFKEVKYLAAAVIAIGIALCVIGVIGSSRKKKNDAQAEAGTGDAEDAAEDIITEDAAEDTVEFYSEAKNEAKEKTGENEQ